MRLGFYLDTSAGTPANTEIYNFLNDNISEFDDVAVFFDDVGFNPVQAKFGFFNGAELWSFKGNVICTSPHSFVSALNVANKLNISYLFTADQKEEKNILELVKIARMGKVLVKNELDERMFHRITGVKPVNIDGLDVNKLKEALGG